MLGGVGVCGGGTWVFAVEWLKRHVPQLAVERFRRKRRDIEQSRRARVPDINSEEGMSVRE